MKTCLIIEDNEDSRVLITRLLEKSRYRTILAATGKEGITAALQQKPDFIILDIQLPDMDGLDVLRAIRSSETGHRISVIAMTSYAMSGDRQRFLASGCDEYIEKPIDPQRVISQIRRAIGDSE